MCYKFGTYDNIIYAIYYIRRMLKTIDNVDYHKCFLPQFLQYTRTSISKGVSIYRLPSVAERILIIELELPLENDLTLALIKTGFSLAHVNDYTEALFSVNVLKPDMIILNHTSGDNMEMCRQLHTAFNVPIILLGKDSGGGAWTKIIQAKSDFFFTKSFNHQEIIARVKSVLRGNKQ